MNSWRPDRESYIPLYLQIEQHIKEKNTSWRMDHRHENSLTKKARRGASGQPKHSDGSS